MIDTFPDSVERFRVNDGPLGTPTGIGRFGVFEFPPETFAKPFGKVRCIVDDGRADEDEDSFTERGTGWEHVSVVEVYGAKLATPSWKVMAKVKDIFWKPSERVVQYHPPEDEYVNCHENVLHLWRPIDGEMPFPPSHLVGPRSRKTVR